MRITKVLAVPALGSYWYEDVGALQDHPVPGDERYFTPAKSPSFRFLKEPGEALSLGLLLSDGSCHWGDAVSVAYGGKAGRDGVFRASQAKLLVDEEIAPAWENTPLSDFRAQADLLSSYAPALRYGFTQALLGAVAWRHKVTPTEILCREWNLPLPTQSVPLHAQCGTNKLDGADRMIARRIASLPHSLVDDIPAQLGAEGEKLVDYAAHLARRIRQLGGEDYAPTIHLDVHGAVGKLFDGELDRIVDWIGKMEAASAPYSLRLESLVVESTLEQQIATMKTLRARGGTAKLVVDEWANSRADIVRFAEEKAADLIQVKMPDVGGLDEIVDAVLACRERSTGILLGGSCNETDLSARYSAQVALAVRPEVILAKPGMGIDEGIALVANEMQRTLSLIATRETT